jgi:CDP-glucose 4,6-dehydratase
MTPSFWAGKRVLITGHNGFKGTWLCKWLDMLGAETFGYALKPDQYSVYGDVKIQHRP